MMRPLVVTQEGDVRIISGMRLITEAINTAGEAEAVDVSTGERVHISLDTSGSYQAQPHDPVDEWFRGSAA